MRKEIPYEIIRVPYCSSFRIFSVYTKSHSPEYLFLSCLHRTLCLRTRLLLSTPADKDKTSDSMADITSYINEHFAEDITIKDLAERALLSPYHFIRLFKKQVGFTPHEYLVNTRINTARYLLKNTGMSTKDICFQCGFSSESVFCNAFKKNTGQTPSAYRSDYSIPNISLATNTPLADAWERE